MTVVYGLGAGICSAGNCWCCSNINNTTKHLIVFFLYCARGVLSKCFVLILSSYCCLQVCEYAMKVTNGDQPMDVIPIAVRYPLLQTWVCSRQMMQQQISKTYGTDDEVCNLLALRFGKTSSVRVCVCVCMCACVRVCEYACDD